MYIGIRKAAYLRLGMRIPLNEMDAPGSPCQDNVLLDQVRGSTATDDTVMMQFTITIFFVDCIMTAHASDDGNGADGKTYSMDCMHVHTRREGFAQDLGTQGTREDDHKLA